MSAPCTTETQRVPLRDLLTPLAVKTVGCGNVGFGTHCDALETSDVVVSGLAYDSRVVVSGDAYFCIPGAVSDGHQFAADAIKRGAVALVVERELGGVEVPQFVVKDARTALAHCASSFYLNPSSKLAISGITGTNGKTTTTYLLDWILKHAGRTTGVLGTVETRVGDQVLSSVRTTPESLDLQRLFADMVAADVSDVTMEVSSHAIALERTYGTSFAAVAFSNLTQDHLDFHHTLEEYFDAKARLFTDYATKSRVVSVDGQWGQRLVDLCRERGFEVITTSVCNEVGKATGGADEHSSAPATNVQATLCAKDITLSASSTTFTLESALEGDGGSFTVSLPLVGAFNIENTLLALGCAQAHGIGLADAVAALGDVAQVPGRLERVPWPAGSGQEFSVLVDYAHTPDSLEKAVKTISAVTEGRTIVVFGCGGDRDKTKRPKMGEAALYGDIAVVTSDNPRSEDPMAIIDDILVGMQVNGLKDRVHVLPDRREAIACAIALAKPSDSVLIAGKGHEDYQLVGDLVLPFDDRSVAAEEVARRCS